MTSAVTVTAITCVSAFGQGMAALKEALVAGRSGLVAFDGADAPLQTYVGQISGNEDVVMPLGFEKFDCRNNRLAEMALGQDGFVETVGAAIQRYGADRVAVILGTSTSGIGSTEAAYQHFSAHGALPSHFDFAYTQELASLSAFVAKRLGVLGPAYTISTACSSSTRSFTEGARLIASGLCDAVIAGGVDSLCETSVRGFNSLQLLSPTPCRPNDRDRDGISIGEAGGFALLERVGTSTTDSNVVLAGYGESSDAYHMSSPHPDGAGAIAAMTAALKMAGLRPNDIGYVNMHGTGSLYNDQVEDAAITAVLGTRTPCSSTKGYGGHTLGAAGILEAAISIIALQGSFAPSNLNLSTLDPSFKSRVISQVEDIETPHVMTNNFGFGGNNCVLIFSKRS